MTSLKKNESGLAAITVTLIVLGIVTLITVGFATLMRREQRQALDQQLSTQAFYAAESGVNAARSYMDGKDIDDINAITDCNDGTDFGTDIQNASDQLGDGVDITCVLLDPTPVEASKTISEQSTWTTRIEAEQPVDNLEISWDSGEASPFISDPDQINGNHLLQDSVWGDRTALLRMMLIPDTNDRGDLIRQTYHAMLYPNQFASVGSPTYVGYPGANPSASDQGVFLNGNCNSGNTPGELCKVVIQNVNQRSFYLHFRSIYNTANVKIRAYTDNTVLELKNVQAKIDATGKAADVVRRIQVYVSLDEKFTPVSTLLPQYALESHTTLCKRFTTWPGEPSRDSGADSDVGSSTGSIPFDDYPDNAGDEITGACDPVTFTAP